MHENPIDAAAKAELDTVRGRLEAELTPAQFALVRQAVNLVEAITAADRDRFEQTLVREYARHLPGVGPVALTLGEHLLDQAPDQVGKCCVPGSHGST